MCSYARATAALIKILNKSPDTVKKKKGAKLNPQCTENAFVCFIPSEKIRYFCTLNTKLNAMKVCNTLRKYVAFSGPVRPEG